MQKRQESTKNVKKCGKGGRSASKGASAAKKAKKSNPAGKREDFLEFSPDGDHRRRRRRIIRKRTIKAPGRQRILRQWTLRWLLRAARPDSSGITTGIYLKSAETARQREAVAAVGAKLEQIGTAGEEILSAVAKEREAAEAGMFLRRSRQNMRKKSWKRIWIWR